MLRDLWNWFTTDRKLLELRLNARFFELSLSLHWGRNNGQYRLSITALDFEGFDTGLIMLLSVQLWLVCASLCLEV